MADVVVRVERLGKRYRIGRRQEERTLREAIVDAGHATWRRVSRLARRRSTDDTATNTVWALKDVSFEVSTGEVLGIIGHNGAGKSTLLKILCRITDPSEGRAEIRSRVASLLEVGTGFHPELTGRENVLLSGVILGMRRDDIRRKFDAIVAFAEVERFIDTPVKHYSSGMYLRLAFAVAAHLEPEILIVDEVLAVGDAAFQRRCLGRMGDVVREGRTVLFVSHNMGAILSLCSRAILLREGRVVEQGRPDVVVSHYLGAPELEAGVPLRERTDREGTGQVRFTGVRLVAGGGHAVEHAISGQPCTLELSYEARSGASLRNVFFQVMVSTATGQPLFVCLTRATAGNFPAAPAVGRALCIIPMLPLGPGGYLVSLTCKVEDMIADLVGSAYALSVLAGDFFGTGRLPPSSSGPVLVHHDWRLEEIPAAAALAAEGARA